MKNIVEKDSHDFSLLMTAYTIVCYLFETTT